MIGEVIKRLRKKRKLSQADLSVKSLIPQGFISDIETGKKAPGLDTIKSLSRSLGVPVGELIEGEIHSTTAEDFTDYNIDKMKWITAQVRRWEIETVQMLDPEDLAETIIKIYEFYVDSGEEVSKASFARIMKLCN